MPTVWRTLHASFWGVFVCPARVCPARVCPCAGSSTFHDFLLCVRACVRVLVRVRPSAERRRRGTEKVAHLGPRRGRGRGRLRRPDLPDTAPSGSAPLAQSGLLPSLSGMGNSVSGFSAATNKCTPDSGDGGQPKADNGHPVFLLFLFYKSSVELHCVYSFMSVKSSAGNLLY